SDDPLRDATRFPERRIWTLLYSWCEGLFSTGMAAVCECFSDTILAPQLLWSFTVSLSAVAGSGRSIPIKTCLGVSASHDANRKQSTWTQKCLIRVCCLTSRVPRSRSVHGSHDHEYQTR